MAGCSHRDATISVFGSRYLCFFFFLKILNEFRDLFLKLVHNAIESKKIIVRIFNRQS